LNKATDETGEFNAQYLITRVRGKCAPLGVKTIISQFWGQNPPKLLKIDLNEHFCSQIR